MALEMASYAAVASLEELLKNIVHYDRYPYPELLLDKQHILRSLRRKFVRPSLDYFSIGNLRADHLERRIRDAAHRAQDIIERMMLNHINSHQRSSTCQIALGQQLRLNKYEEELRKLEADLRKLEEEVDSIEYELKAIKDGTIMQQSNYSTGDDPFRPTPMGKGKMVGFDEQKRVIMDVLIQPRSLKFQVIPIVGMGGSGKTTMARNIFEDACTVDHFYCRGWTTISQHYHVNGVLRSILESMGVTEPLGGEDEDLHLKIHQHLIQKPYLVVIDDIWSTEVWDDLRRILPSDCRRSRIVLTTRLSNVGQYAVGISGFLYKMPFLNEDESWELLRCNVWGQELCPPELENIGKLIASKCRGLPLAIIAIARILSIDNRAKKQCWDKIAIDVDSILSNDENLSRSLSRSYDSLPHQLKACLLHMGSFPMGYEINVSTLIKLWTAEGFLESVGRSETLKQAAEDYLMDLVQRNLILVTKKRANGDFKLCRMHDLLRNFCRQRAFSEDFFCDENDNGHLHPSGVENVRRINLYRTSPYEPRPFNTGNLVRSMLWFGNTSSSNFDTIELDSFKLLRVLGLRVTTTWPIPEAIFQMFHLKYLDLYLKGLAQVASACLPPSMSALQNLQSLIISSLRFYSITLPPQVWNMTQLQHLIISGMTLPPIPIVRGIPVRKLDNLETLMTIENFIFTSDVVEVIPNLRKLKMSCTRNEDSGIWELYCLDILDQLRRLEELKIIVDVAPVSCVDSVWSNFTLPLNLRKLSLGGCGFSWEEMTVVGSLPNLQVLRLRKDSFMGEKWIPIEGEFKHLKFLLLEELDLEFWGADSVHFPCLEHLTIKGFTNLEWIPIEIGDLVNLRLIDVYESEGAAELAMKILEDQQQQGNNELQVRVHN